eukprot:2204646-Rhodomonas_salina.3
MVQISGAEMCDEVDRSSERYTCTYVPELGHYWSGNHSTLSRVRKNLNSTTPQQYNYYKAGVCWCCRNTARLIVYARTVRFAPSWV